MSETGRDDWERVVNALEEELNSVQDALDRAAQSGSRTNKVDWLGLVRRGFDTRLGPLGLTELAAFESVLLEAKRFLGNREWSKKDRLIRLWDIARTTVRQMIKELDDAAPFDVAMLRAWSHVESKLAEFVPQPSVS